LDLKSLAEQIQPTRGRWWTVAAGALVIPVVGILFWVLGHRKASFALLQVKQQPRTINSPENAVTSGALSPDGKSFVFVDAKGLHVRSTKGDEARDLSFPEPPKDQDIEWQIVSPRASLCRWP
jgi:hypothetical protein